MSPFEPTARDQAPGPVPAGPSNVADVQRVAGVGRAAAAEQAGFEHLNALAQLDELELGEHPDVYQRIHAELQAALAAIDDA